MTVDLFLTLCQKARNILPRVLAIISVFTLQNVLPLFHPVHLLKTQSQRCGGPELHPAEALPADWQNFCCSTLVGQGRSHAAAHIKAESSRGPGSLVLRVQGR